MKVNEKYLTTIWYDENKDHIDIIDQTMNGPNGDIKKIDIFYYFFPSLYDFINIIRLKFLR